MISIIINPVSGGVAPRMVQRRVELARALLAARGEQGDVLVTERRGHAVELASAAVRRGDRLVVSWGGDGTMNEVASTIVGTGTALGLVPSGSGNGLARELGLAHDPAVALRDALAATPRAIDAGQLSNRWFFSVAGVGFDAHVAAVFDQHIGGRRGLSSYVRITARELRQYSPSLYRIDGGAQRAAFLVTFANAAQFGNGVRIAPAARVDDGRLDVVVFEERSRVRTILNLPRLFTGSVGCAPGVSMRQVTHAVVECDTPMVYHVDGEPVQGGTRLEARVVPGALRVAWRS